MPSVVYIVDGDGAVVSHFTRENGFQHATQGTQIGTLVPEVKSFFLEDNLAEVYSDENRVHAIKVRLDPRHSTDTLGIVLTL